MATSRGARSEAGEAKAKAAAAALAEAEARRVAADEGRIVGRRGARRGGKPAGDGARGFVGGEIRT